MKTRASLVIICLALLILWPGRGAAVSVIYPTDAGRVTIHSEYRRLSQGEVVKVTLVSPEAASAKVSFDGKEYPFASDPEGLKHFTLIVLRLDMEPGTYDAVVHLQPVHGVPKDIAFKLALSRGTFPSSMIRVAQRFTSPTAAQLNRIREEQAFLRGIYTSSVPDWLGTGKFVMPVDDRVTGVFGARRIFNDEVVSRHRGVDIRSPAGTPVKASNTGKVVLARDLYFSGNTVILNHGIGLFSIYCHLSETVVREGTVIEKGTVIGRVGSTGRSTGPHLHWGLRLGDDYADPLSIVHLSFD